MLRDRSRGFTLLELLVVIGVITVLIGILIPALSRARSRGQTLTCITNLRELGRGFDLYMIDNNDTAVPGRMANFMDAGPSAKQNWYDVGNGLKYRPRWAGMLGPHVGVFGFEKPIPPPWSNGGTGSGSLVYDRQDYDHELYRCPEVPEWVDERNHAYGYNYQFLGNARRTSDQYHNFPVRRHQIVAPSGTVVAADAMGTAAGYGRYEREPYQNDGKSEDAQGNHGWSLDPPRLTKNSDRGSGDPGSARTAVDPRHQKKVNVVFADGHGDLLTDYELGYRLNADGSYADFEGDVGASSGPGSPAQAGPGPEDPATNKMFSGSGRDDDPPPLPFTTS